MKIEAGKYYKDASGNHRGPMNQGSSQGVFVSMGDFGSPLYWLSNGACVIPKFNITAEWTEDQIGTLEELDVKPGDVVEWIEHSEYKQMTVENAKTLANGPFKGEVKARLTNYGDGIFGPACQFRLISRATPKPSIDLTAIREPFGLLDKATQDALIAHGGPYQYFCGDGWYDAFTCDEVPEYVHRVKPGPKRETVTKDAWIGNSGQVCTTEVTPNCTITYDTLDGVIDVATYRVVAK